MRVLFTFAPEDRLREHFENELGEICQLVFATQPEPGVLLDLLEDADAVVGWLATEEMVERAKQVRLWQNPGVGVTHLVHLFENRPDITLANCHGNTYFTAQHAVAMLLTLVNRVNLHHNWMLEGRWRTRDGEAKSIPMRNRRVGLLGYGHIGLKVARFLSGFDVRLSAYKTRRKAGDEDLEHVQCHYRSENASLERFVENSDILVITLPLTPRTEGLVDERLLRALGPDGLLVNVGRGAIVVEDDLYRALKTGTIAGAAIDVWWREKNPREFDDGGIRPFDRPFHRLENVVMSPHRAASPFDDLARWDEVIENVRRATLGRDEFLNVVDVKRGY